ncbi:phage tail protein [Aeromonas hydrophila]|uniref:phage tail protein n=1 Tax=Aeromonas hydrophila TaxID=644 RepID=UPI00203CD717|nr:phage tail protein [Aeromonas hydrophila]
MSAIYSAILTAAGQAKLANAVALGVPLKITHMAVGDGNGQPVTPNAAQTALVRERRRAPINTLFQDPTNQSQLVAEQIIPENVGDWWIREAGIFSEDGTLIAIANTPDTYKPLLSSGAGRTQVIRIVLIVSDTSAVELKIDPSVVLATRKYVDDVMKAHKESRDHPDATELAKGLTQYANLQKALTGEADNLALTPKVMKAVLLALGLTKYGAPMIGVPIDWPLEQMPQDIWPDCGMVFLSCAGQSFNKTTYPIAAQLYPSGVIPEIRAEFVRAWDNGRGIDIGRALLSYQAAENVAHHHFDLFAKGGTPGGVGEQGTAFAKSFYGPNDSTIRRSDSGWSGQSAGIFSSTSGGEGHPRSISFHKIMRVG